MLPNGSTAAATPEPIPPAQPSDQANTQPGDGQENQQAQPKYVTQEQLDQVMAEAIRRVKQSDRDRAQAIDKRLTEITGMLQAANVQVSQEQTKAIRDKITDQLDQPDKPGAETSAVPHEFQAQLDYVYGQIEEAFNVAGTKVLPADPEWKAIQAALDDPKGSLAKTLVAATKAADAKQQRTTTMQDTADARVGGGGSSITGHVPATNARDMLEQAFSAKR